MESVYDQAHQLLIVEGNILFLGNVLLVLRVCHFLFLGLLRVKLNREANDFGVFRRQVFEMVFLQEPRPAFLEVTDNQLPQKYFHVRIDGVEDQAYPLINASIKCESLRHGCKGARKD